MSKLSAAVRVREHPFLAGKRVSRLANRRAAAPRLIEAHRISDAPQPHPTAGDLRYRLYVTPFGPAPPASSRMRL